MRPQTIESWLGFEITQSIARGQRLHKLNNCQQLQTKGNQNKDLNAANNIQLGNIILHFFTCFVLSPARVFFANIWIRNNIVNNGTLVLLCTLTSDNNWNGGTLDWFLIVQPAPVTGEEPIGPNPRIPFDRSTWLTLAIIHWPVNLKTVIMTSD